MRAAVIAGCVLAIGGCRVAALDYEGKNCPCPEGYQCDLASQTCTTDLLPADARANDGRLPDGSPMTDSCFANPKSSLVYASIGFADFPNSWLNGNGSWTKMGAELQQANSANELAWLSHALPTTNGSQSYRLVATARVIDVITGTGAAGLAFRLSFTGTMYTCSFTPTTGDLRLVVTQNLIDTTLQARNLGIVADPSAPFTIEITANGSSQSCCVRGYTNSLLSAQDMTLTTGTIGVEARKAEAGFTSFYVYE
ncbi:MAG TPA: hypothetical protein VIV40_44540 [Kofleriaceae bacterium]